jgi:dTDP-4-dehydrorhamnose 3,5-epimerase
VPNKVTFTGPPYCEAFDPLRVTDSLAHVQVRPLSIEGLWEFTPVLRPDDRGVFLESFTESAFVEAVGHSFDLRQMNISVSRAGTVRGVHFADIPPSQAKYVQCFVGRILDVVVDIRVGSPTFGQWDAVELDDQTRSGLYVAEGLGHAFCALSETVTIGYLCSEPYAPTREHGITPLDPDLDLPWPSDDVVLSAKDAAAPTLAEALARGMLPTYADYRQMRPQNPAGGVA